MSAIRIKKGLDIPMNGLPQGSPKKLHSNGRDVPITHFALDFSPFEELRFTLLVKQDERVKLGQPLAEDKAVPGRYFVSPAGGIVKEIKRGLKRRLLSIVIAADGEEEKQVFEPLSIETSTRETLIQRLKEGGLFAHIRQRPFNLLAHPASEPRAIFVKAIESAPGTPPAEMQVLDHETEFQAGLSALKKLTTGLVHLIYREESPCKAFTEAKDVSLHTIEGPHPAGNSSIHIHHIDPIRSAQEVVWTLSTLDVIAIGTLLLKGEYYVDRIIGICGNGIIDGLQGYFFGRMGCPISALTGGRVEKGWYRLISGNCLTGQKVEVTDFLGFYDTCFTVIPENTDREFMHFFRPGMDKYSASRTYLSGFFHNQTFDFTTSMHGEHRAFVIGSPYDAVMPMNLTTEVLVKAIMAEDYDLAEELGLLEIDSEDFALPSFVCPCKIEMVEIVKQGLRAHAKEVLQ